MRIDKYGDMFADLVIDIKTDLESKSDEELINVIFETKKLTMTNCAWSTYRMKDTVKEEAEDILRLRELNKQD